MTSAKMVHHGVGSGGSAMFRFVAAAFIDLVCPISLKVVFFNKHE